MSDKENHTIDFDAAERFARFAQRSYDNCNEDVATREATISISISLAVIAHLLERMCQGLTVYDGNM